MKKYLPIVIVLLTLAGKAQATDKGKFISIGTGLFYERGWDLTVSVEHETRYHNAWEYFGNVYLKWEDCSSCGHICPESFWKNYNSWGVGAAYKLALVRKRNSTGRMRLGASVGSDRNRFLGGLHVGYEHNYVTRTGVVLYWQVKSDMMLKGKDLFRTGVVLGVKFPF